jgi:hypothetical protein
MNLLLENDDWHLIHRKIAHFDHFECVCNHHVKRVVFLYSTSLQTCLAVGVSCYKKYVKNRRLLENDILCHVLIEQLDLGKYTIAQNVVVFDRPILEHVSEYVENVHIPFFPSNPDATQLSEIDFAKMRKALCDLEEIVAMDNGGEYGFSLLLNRMREQFELLMTQPTTVNEVKDLSIEMEKNKEEIEKTIERIIRDIILLNMDETIMIPPEPNREKTPSVNFEFEKHWNSESFDNAIYNHYSNGWLNNVYDEPYWRESYKATGRIYVTNQFTHKVYVGDPMYVPEPIDHARNKVFELSTTVKNIAKYSQQIEDTCKELRKLYEKCPI